MRQPLSTRQLYNEMILQRIAQGFQLVILSKKQLSLSEAAPTTSIIRAKGKSQQPVDIFFVQHYFTGHLYYLFNFS